MAPPPGTLRVWRYFAALFALLAVLYLIVFWPGSRNTPKLGTDLVGGTSVIFTAKTIDGGKPPSSSLNQARNIMSERVNGTGVTQATVVVLGQDKLKVEIPGHDAADITKLGAAAQLNLRPLMVAATPLACAPTTAAPTPSGSASSAPSSSPGPSAGPKASNTPASSAPASPNSDDHAPLAAPTTTAAASGSGTPTPTTTATTTGSPAASPSASPTAAASTPPAPGCVADPFADLTKAKVKIPTTEDEFNKLDANTQTAVKAALGTFDCASAQEEKDDPNSYYLACDSTGSVVYLFQKVLVPGTQIDSATASPPSPLNGKTQWTVDIEFKSSGSGKWASWTSKYNTGGQDSSTLSSSDCGASSAYPCSTWVGFTLDGVATSVPVTINAINGGQTQVSGSFNQSSAKDLANKLKYGALPLKFTAENPRFTSATLGATQLKYGLIAGGIGLVLVIIYSLIYYRLLGLVTIASLIVSGLLVYGSVVMLGEQIDFTLSLAGIAGFIVAIGITADSFVVFFERIKEEVHEGRSSRVAIPRAWIRARRTIITADVVSFLAAAVLYYFTSDEVRGFAFTLGLSTLLDVAVVFLFTHPLVSWLSRFKAFGSRQFTGLDAVREAPVAPKRGVNVRKSNAAEAVAGADEPAADEPAADEPGDLLVDTDEELSEADRETLAADARAAARRARLRADKEGGVL